MNSGSSADEKLDVAQDKAAGAAKEVQHSPVYRGLVQVGIIAYGIVHLLVAWLGFGLATGRQDADKANQVGALATLSEAPMGKALLGLIMVGFAMMVIWQVITLLVGNREYDGGKRLQKQFAAAARAITYGVLGFTAGKIAFGISTDQDSQKKAAGTLMSMTGGPMLVGLVGLAILGYALYQFYKGYSGAFNEDLDEDLTGRGKQGASVGFYGKGIAYLVVGILFISASMTLDPQRAGGLDVALAELLKRPLGPVLLVLTSLGIGVYGLYCFYWARHAKQA